jgi:hypothetical protein
LQKCEKRREIMKKLEIFDPAMCCSTGVCGPSIDDNLMRVATVINRLREKGFEVNRYGLASEPFEFISNQIVNGILGKEGADILPITLLDGEVVKKGEYPSNEEFATWFETQLDDLGNKNNCDGKEGCC